MHDIRLMRYGRLLLRAMAPIMGVLACGTAHAQEATGHLLTIRLAPGASWQQETTTTSQNDSLYPDAVDQETTIYRHTAKPAADGYRVVRTLEKRTATRTGGDPELDAIALRHSDNYPDKMAATLKRVDYRTDARLAPQDITNWADIARRQHALQVKTFGEEIAEGELKPNDAVNPIDMVLSLEVVMAALRTAPLVPGQAHATPVAISGSDGGALAATRTIVLTEWNLATDEAHYTLVTEITPEAAAGVLKAYFLQLMYPLNTMDEAQLREYQDTAQRVASQSSLKDANTCRFTASIATGLVTDGTCTREVAIENAFHKDGTRSTTTVKQKLL